MSSVQHTALDPSVLEVCFFCANKLCVFGKTCVLYTVCGNVRYRPFYCGSSIKQCGYPTVSENGIARECNFVLVYVYVKRFFVLVY